jgi:hypothetical protein
MNFKRINNVTGWLVCLIACTVYIMTMEATGSFWDCGEFVSSCYKLQIPHPPGAPLFVLMGRIFTIPFDPKHASTGVNLMSALASGFTILFLFWTITHYARKIVQKGVEEMTGDQVFSVMAAGVVGALAYTFSDSFWYSAVEGEVYALSSFFTAVVFWAMVKWEQAVDKETAQGITGHFTGADRWIILIFYLMGLSIGVHLLNLLTIPAIVLIYYYKRYKPTNRGTLLALLIGMVITGLVQKAVIVWSIKGAGAFDIWFVNSFGLPFFSGFAFFFLFIGTLVYFGIRLANKNNWNFLKLGLWSFVFMLMGYSTYFTTLVRSNADPSVDMYNVDNPVNLVGYLSREQYGDWPILYGQDFTASPSEVRTENTYIKANGRYEKSGRKVVYEYASADKHLFPRMWDQSNDQGHADYYASYAGIGKDQQGNYDRAPTFGENIGFFGQYQMNWMYFRYFMWNFAGKQNDVQGVNFGNVRDGNWLTGISFLDNARLGDQSQMPDSMKHNKANNKLFMLPLILGLMGVVFQVMRNSKDALVVGMLFFFTGIAIVLYLNQAGNQPRERDYAYVGSFYAFAIWIGLGVLWVKEIFTNLTKSSKLGNIIAAAVCTLAVPVLMASQEWDDHDRSKKFLARDLAIDYLESCAPNGIVITFGDNDTYPLWYAQEVEGVRRDLRIINASLLGTDWYINQLRYKLNESPPIDPIWSASQIEGAKRDYIVNHTPSGVNGNAPMDLYTMMKDYAGSDDQAKMMPPRTAEDEFLNAFPTRLVTVPVDQALVRQNGTVNAEDSVVSQLQFEIPKRVLYKNDAAILNIIAANKWKRPIYFTSPYESLGFGRYLRMDGLTYRLVPVENKEADKTTAVNDSRAKDVLMNKFVFGNAHVPGVYFDEENRRHLNSIRGVYAQAAISAANRDKKEDGRKMLAKCDQMMLEENFAYGMVSRYQMHNITSFQMLQAAYACEDTVLAAKITKSLKKDLTQQMEYYISLNEDRRDALSYEERQTQALLQNIQAVENQYKSRQQAPVKPPVESAQPVAPSGPAPAAPTAPPKSN